jgi:SHS2 domain-containing protein
VPWRHVPHTADVALEVEAARFEALCAEAADALVALLVVDPGAGGRAAVARTVRLPAAAEPELLHGWLSAVLLAFELERWVTDGAVVRRVAGGLEAELRGAPFDPDRHGVCAEVKAVTWHGLVVERGGEGWRARVLLDL